MTKEADARPGACSGARAPWTIVLAAGEGTRLRALTRALHGEALPKQFAVIQGARSLLQMTVARTSRWSPPEKTVVVVAREREALARAQLAAQGGIDVVPQPRNLGTGPGVLLPLSRVMARDRTAMVVVVPSDHYVDDEGPFIESIRRAAAVAKQRDCVVLIGAVPDRPETEYGWILPARRENGRRVSGFHEKPKMAVAEELLATGALWNTFIIVGPADRLWELGEEHLPAQSALLEQYLEVIGAPEEREVLERLYETMPAADFSRSVLEKAHGLRVVPLSPCGWSDWGTPERVMRSLRGSADFDILVERLNQQEAKESGFPAKSRSPQSRKHRAA